MLHEQVSRTQRDARDAHRCRVHRWEIEQQHGAVGGPRYSIFHNIAAVAQSESLSSSAALLFLFSFLAFLAAFSSFFLRLRSAFSSAVSSSSCLRFFVFSEAASGSSPVGATAGAARTSAVEVVSASGADSTSVLLKSLYSVFHLAGVFSLGRPNF
jgi:hypothetical protein